jgi:hypothetical protein
MRSIRILSLALLTSAAFAPAAFAQDSSTTDTASGKHFAVVGGISLLQPKNDPIDRHQEDRWWPGADRQLQLLHQRQLGR